MGDRGTKPSSSMISRPRWNSFRCRLSSRLSSRAAVHFTPFSPARRPPAGVLLQHGTAGPPGLPHGRGVRRDGPGPPVVLAGNSPVYGPGWKSLPFATQVVAGKPGLFLPGRKLYFCHSSQGCSGMTLYGYARVSVREPEDKKSGPAGGAAGPRRLLPGQYSSGGSSAWRAPAPRIPRKRPAWSVIQQPVPHGPDHDLLLRAKTQLHLNGVDGVSYGNHLNFPCLGNRGV